jgi:hypothetical protein
MNKMNKLLLLFIFVLTFSFLTSAATFVVNNNGDSNEANASSNVCADALGKRSFGGNYIRAVNSTLTKVRVFNNTNNFLPDCIQNRNLKPYFTIYRLE